MGLDKWMVAHAEYAPGQRGRIRLVRLHPLQTFPGLASQLETAGAAGLVCELLKRAHIAQDDHPAHFVLAIELLQELSNCPGSGPVRALFALHHMLRALSLLAPSIRCARCEADLAAPAYLDPSTGEVTCSDHSLAVSAGVLWGVEKWSVHVALFRPPNLADFLARTAPLWDVYGDGLAWSMLDDLIGLATHSLGALRSWAFLLQLRPKSRRQ